MCDNRDTIPAPSAPDDEERILALVPPMRADQTPAEWYLAVARALRPLVDGTS